MIRGENSTYDSDLRACCSLAAAAVCAVGAILSELYARFIIAGCEERVETGARKDGCNGVVPPGLRILQVRVPHHVPADVVKVGRVG